MADRDKYGNYVNDKGVTIKITTDKNGNDHISFYGGEVDKPHDAAHVNMGGKWKMPTNNQLNELLNNTTYEVVGVQGMMFTSKINNKQLFIPFMQGSWCDGNWHTWSSGCAIVWSSQVAAPFANFTVDLVCYCHGYALVGKNLRSYAFSVRGVFKK